MGYPGEAAEVDMLSGHEARDQVMLLEPVVDAAALVEAQEIVRRVHASRPLREYIVALLRRTREDPRLELGASPRAGLMLLRAAKARAVLRGREHVLPDDVQALAEAVLAHRVVLSADAGSAERAEIIADVVRTTPAL